MNQEGVSISNKEKVCHRYNLSKRYFVTTGSLSVEHLKFLCEVSMKYSPRDMLLLNIYIGFSAQFQMNLKNISKVELLLGTLLSSNAFFKVILGNKKNQKNFNRRCAN